MNKKTFQLLEEIKESLCDWSHPFRQNFWIELVEEIKRESRSHNKELRRRFHRRFNQRPLKLSFRDSDDIAAREQFFQD